MVLKTDLQDHKFDLFIFFITIVKLKKRSLNNRIPILVRNNQRTVSAVFFISIKFYKKSRKSYKFAAK